MSEFCVPPSGRPTVRCYGCQEKEIQLLRKDLLLSEAKREFEKYKAHAGELERILALYQKILEAKVAEEEKASGNK